MITFIVSALNEPIYFFIPLGLLVLAIILLIIGLINLKIYKKYRAYVFENAKNTTCLITRVYTYTIYGKHTRDRYMIAVEYNSEDGKVLKKDVSIGIYTWKELKAGMRISCKVYQDICFINRNNINVVEEVLGE